MRSLKLNDKSLLLISIIFALLCIPGYIFFGIWFKLLVAPIIVLMVLSKRVVFFPSLILQNFLETTISYIILLSIVFLTYWNIKKCWKKGTRAVIVILTILLIILAYQTFYRTKVLGEDLLTAFKPDIYFLSFYTYFYGFLFADQIEMRKIKGLGVIFSLAVIFNLLNVYGGTIRIIFFIIPFFFTYYLIRLISSSKYSIKLSDLLAFLLTAVYIVLIKFTTLTAIGVIIFSLVITFFAARKISKGLNFFTSKWLLATVVVITFLWLLGPISGRSENGFFNGKKQIIGRIEGKLFLDRGPLWSSALKSIRKIDSYLPPVKQQTILLPNNQLITPELKYIMFSHRNEIKEYEVTYGAHNIYLELVLKYGYIFGLLLAGIFIYFFYKPVKFLSSQSDNLYFTSLGSTIIATGFVGGMTGQYTLMAAFGFLFFSLSGMFSKLGETESVEQQNDTCSEESSHF